MSDSPIVDINQIPPQTSRKNNHYAQTIIPETFQNRIIELINDMEAELNQRYFVFVKELSKNETEVYPLEERTHTYEVIMKDPEYQVINGKYFSLKDINDAIRRQANLEFSKTVTLEEINGRSVWKCPQCKTYGNKRDFSINGFHSIFSVNETPKDNYGSVCCSSCLYKLEYPRSNWYILHVYPQTGYIGYYSEGSVSILHEMGTLKIIN